jgi:hypothetical protein
MLDYLPYYYKNNIASVFDGAARDYVLCILTKFPRIAEQAAYLCPMPLQQGEYNEKY